MFVGRARRQLHEMSGARFESLERLVRGSSCSNKTRANTAMRMQRSSRLGYSRGIGTTHRVTMRRRAASRWRSIDALRGATVHTPLDIAMNADATGARDMFSAVAVARLQARLSDRGDARTWNIPELSSRTARPALGGTRRGCGRGTWCGRIRARRSTGS